MLEQNDSVETIPVPVIQLAAVRAQLNPAKYKPSYVARIINRAIRSENQENVEFLGLGRGVYTRRDPSEVSMALPGGNFIYKDSKRHLRIEGITFPGLTYGEEIMSKLDVRYQQIAQSSMSPDSLLNLAALSTIVIGNTHPFPDTNGRSGVGVADFTLRRFSNKALDYSKLAARSSELNRIMAITGFLLFPNSYNPKTTLQDMEIKGEAFRLVKAPIVGKTPIDEVRDYLEAYYHSIVSFVETYDTTVKIDDDLDAGSYVAKLAGLYKAVIVAID